MSRGTWPLVILSVLLIITAAAVITAIIDDPRNGWAAGLFALGTMVGITWDSWRKRRPSRRDGGEG